MGASGEVGFDDPMQFLTDGRHAKPIAALVAIAIAAVVLTAPIQAQEVKERFLGVANGSLGPFRHGTKCTGFYSASGLVDIRRRREPSTSSYTATKALVHVGVDIVAAEGSEITSLADGKVVETIGKTSDPNFGSLGYMVLLAHDTRIRDRPTWSMYLHLHNPPAVGVGDVVKAGLTILGYVGQTGAAFGPHVHLEVRHFRERFFPMWANIYGKESPPGEANFSEQDLLDNWEDPLALFGNKTKDGAEIERRLFAAAWAEAEIGEECQPCTSSGCAYNRSLAFDRRKTLPPCAKPTPPARSDGKGAHLPWFYWCARFVANAYGQEPEAGYDDATQLHGALQMRTDPEIPIGALVFWDVQQGSPQSAGGAIGKAIGHVGIALRDGRVIHTGLKVGSLVRSDPLAAVDKAAHRIGWAQAPANWPGRSNDATDGARPDLERGLVHSYKKEWKDALDCLKRAVARDPGRALSHVRLGEAYGYLGLAQDGLEEVKQALALAPNEPDGYRVQGALLARLQRWGEATRAFKKAVDLDPDSPELHRELGRCYDKMKLHAQAIAAFGMAEERGLDDPDTWCDTGMAYAAEGLVNSALAAFDRALESRPAFPEALYGKSVAYGKMGQQLHLQERLSVLQRALQLRPDYGQALTERAFAVKDLDACESGLPALRERFARVPTDSDAGRRLASALEGMGRWQDAADALRQIVALHPNDADAQHELGLVLGKGSASEESVQVLLKAIDLRRTEALPHYNLAIVYLNLGRFDKAMEQRELVRPLNELLARDLDKMMAVLLAKPANRTK